MKNRLISLLLLLLSVNLHAALYIVGSATEFNWSRQEMRQTSDGVYRWEGYLSHSGELKFMTTASDWTSHWGPAKALSPLSYGTFPVSLHASGDYKFLVAQSGYYLLEVNTRTKQLLACLQDGSLPEAKTWPWAVYPVGTAATAAGNYALTEEGDDTGVYAGRLVLGEGSLAFHTRPYRTGRGARPVEPRLARTATTTMKKLYLTLSTDRCAYRPGETVTITSSVSLPAGTRVRYRHLGDVVADTALTTSKWTWRVPDEDFRGYMAEVYTPEQDHDVILGTVAIDVSSDWNRFPRYGFVASYGSDKTLTTVRNEMNKLLRCHINAVQFQDWHFCHDQPLAGTVEKPSSTYKDIANRTIYLSSVKNYIKRQHELGMQSIFYNLCFGVLDGYESRGVKDEWLVYKDRNHTQKDSHDLPSSWKSDIYLANPANPAWQSFLADRNDDVYTALDFDGFQIDQLGYRGTRYDYNGAEVNMAGGYADFIQAMKRRHPGKRLIMNAVSEYGTGEIVGTGKMDALYNEVWGCHSNDALTSGEAQFANLKTILDNNRKANPGLQTIFAAYMNYCCDNTNFNTPGIVMADAVMMALGGSHLELGGDHNLCREYFPYASVKTTTELEDWLIHYYDFMTAYENLLRGDWTENTAIAVTATGATVNKWAPRNGQITQVARTVEGRKVIHLLNFNCQESSQVTDPNYLLCWHDRDGLRPWPVEYQQLPLKITGMSGTGKVRRVWVASPDYMGGALQEITDYKLTSTTLTLTLPALQFWTMIVIEPESTTMTGNEIYGSSVPGNELVSSGSYPIALQKTADAGLFALPAEGVFTARLSLPDERLYLTRDSEDAVLSIPVRTQDGETWTIDGRHASPSAHGILIRDGRKVFSPWQ